MKRMRLDTVLINVLSYRCSARVFLFLYTIFLRKIVIFDRISSYYYSSVVGGCHTGHTVNKISGIL